MFTNSELTYAVEKQLIQQNEFLKFFGREKVSQNDNIPNRFNSHLRVTIIKGPL